MTTGGAMCENGHCIIGAWRNGKFVYICINCEEEVG